MDIIHIFGDIFYCKDRTVLIYNLKRPSNFKIRHQLKLSNVKCAFENICILAMTGNALRHQSIVGCMHMQDARRIISK